METVARHRLLGADRDSFRQQIITHKLYPINQREMKASISSLRAAVAVVSFFPTIVDATCGKLKGCYLRDIKKSKATGSLKEVELTDRTVFTYTKNLSEYSIRCDVDGNVNEVQFALGQQSHKTWGAPYWISGSWGDWVQPSEWLQFCGETTFTVSAKTWASNCFNHNFVLISDCREKSAQMPTMSPPTPKTLTAAPSVMLASSSIKPEQTSTTTTKERTSSPTTAPTKLPTVSPTMSPTKEPTSSPTKQPTMSPTPRPEPNHTDTECNGKPLTFDDEKPCLSGMIRDTLISEQCTPTNIISALYAAFHNAKRYNRWGHNYHRNLGFQQKKQYFHHIQQQNTKSTTCPWDFDYELLLITGTLSREKAEWVLQKMCDVAERDSVRSAEKTKWTDIDPRLTPKFLSEYTNGGTDLNTKIGNFQNRNKNTDPRLNRYYPTDNFSYTMGVSIDSFFRTGGRTSALQPVEHLNQCKHQAVMCCFGGDRQYDDNNGNCAQNNCDYGEPGDNTDICYANGRRYRGNEPGHCHGYAWSRDLEDADAKMRFNNLFYVVMHDHMYSRGYVKSVKYGVPMCSCLEDMPIVSRADCSEIKMLSNYKLSVEESGKIDIKVDRLNFEFQACQGYQPGTKRAQNNDLLAKMERLYQEQRIDAPTRKTVDRYLVQNCASAGY